MKRNNFYINIALLNCECTCVGITQTEWDQLMKDKTRACKRSIDRLLKKHLPDLYHALALEYYNPYNYFKTKTHLIVVHSGIEHFIRYTTKQYL